MATTEMNKDNMSRNAEHYADPTPAAALRNINKDERQKEAVRFDRIGSLVPLLRQMEDIAGFEIIGRIPLEDGRFELVSTSLVEIEYY